MNDKEFAENVQVLRDEVKLTEFIMQTMSVIIKAQMEAAKKTGNSYQIFSEEQINDLNTGYDDLIKYYNNISQRAEKMGNFIKNNKKRIQ